MGVEVTLTRVLSPRSRGKLKRHPPVYATYAYTHDMSSWLLPGEERHRCVDVASGVGKILPPSHRRKEGRREGEVSKLRRRRRRISKRMSRRRRRRRRRIWREKAAMEKGRRSRGVCNVHTIILEYTLKQEGSFHEVFCKS